MKLLQKNKKKGFFYIDFIFIILIFFLIFSYFYKDYQIKMNDYTIQNDNLVLTKEAEDICFMLVKTSGFPTNWETNLSNVTYLGLKSLSNHSLDAEKINGLNSSYETLVNKLNDFEEIGIKIQNLNNSQTYLNLGVFSKNLLARNSGKYICFSNFNGEIVKVIVDISK